MFFQRFYDDTLAQTSYLIGCAATGEAMVLDPNRDAAQYVRAAEEEGLRITHVTETHIHADFLSGARELAHLTGAVMYLSDEGGPGWQYAFAKQGGAVLLHDGDHFMVGNIRFDVLHTPGHTPGSVCVLANGVLFAGDSRCHGCFAPANRSRQNWRALTSPTCSSAMPRSIWRLNWR